MLSDALDQTVIADNLQIFWKKIFQHYIHHKKILKVTKFQFKIICRSRVLGKNMPLRYIVPLPHPGANRVNSVFTLSLPNYLCFPPINNISNGFFAI